MHWEGRDAQQWQRIWNAGAVHLFESVGSTSDVIASLAEQGAPHFTVAVADEQTRGRGRGGSVWTARPGSALLFSVLFRIDKQDAVPGAAPIRIGVAVASAIEDARIKWPNDVVIPGHGKVAGILCEGTFGSHIVAGIGINVRQQQRDFPAELRGRACSVSSAHGGRDVDRAEMLGVVLQRLKEIDERLVLPLDRAELEALARLDVLRGNVVVCDVPNEKITGVATGIAEDGALLIDQEGSIRRIYNGTVRLAADAAYPGTARLL